MTGLLLIISACTCLPAATGPAGPATDDAVHSANAANEVFHPRQNMTRATIEEVYGPPAHLGRDRQGRTHCLYRVNDRWHSVLYDQRGLAVEWHP